MINKIEISLCTCHVFKCWFGSNILASVSLKAMKSHKTNIVFFIRTVIISKCVTFHFKSLLLSLIELYSLLEPLDHDRVESKYF